METKSIKSVFYNANSLYPTTIGANTIVFNAEGLMTQYGNYQFTYNHKGLRVRKYNINTGEYTLYYYDENDNIIGEDYSDSIKIRYMYDNEGIMGARFINGSIITNYEYVLDGFNNVTGILNNGVQVAKYEYDAFGDLIYSYTNDYFSQINPFRYRGYYYDVETNLYYLKARLYSAEWGRFISPDSVEYLDHETINGLNLYCYCMNDPVNKYDPTGHFFISLGLFIGATILGATLGAGVSVVSQAAENNWDWNKVNYGVVASDTIFGAINGALAVTGIGMLGSALSGAALNGLQTLVNTAIEGKKINSAELGLSIGLGFLGGFIPGSGFKALDMDGIYTTSATKLLTAKSAEKIAMYTAKQKLVVNTIIKGSLGYIGTTIGSSGVSLGLDLLGIY